VLVTRWEWNGRERLGATDPGTLLPARARQAGDADTEPPAAVPEPLFP